jgi:membrane protein YqaA with SNARE-associated domain
LLAKITSALVAYGPWGVFVLGLVDSVGIPLPATVDVLIILIAVKAQGRGYFAALLGVLGSALGNLILFEMARFGVRRFVKMAEEPGRFRTWFHRYGLVTVFIPAATPVLPLPLKFFVVSAGALHAAVGRFLGVILLARFLRYVGDAFLGVKLGVDAQGFLQHNAWTLVGAVIGLAAALLALIRWSDRRRGPTSLGRGIPAGGDIREGPVGPPR